MKLICNKKDLVKGVSIVSKAVSSKTTLSILECILLDFSSGIIKLVANDMDLGIETIVEGEIIEGGVIAIEAKLFSEIVRKLPDSEVVIQADNDYRTIITCEKAKFEINCKSGEEFVSLPKIEKDNSITISEFILKDVIRQTLFSTSDNESNKMMTGELFSVESNILKVSALDGHRIAHRKIELKEQYVDTSVIVPGKTLSEISKILSGEVDQNVTIYFTQNHILFEFESTKVVSRLIEGTFFNIEKMIFRDYSTKVTMNKRDLMSSIERSLLLVKEGDKKPIVFDIKEDKVDIKMRSQIGNMDEDLVAERIGDELMIGFNPKFLLDALKAIDEENITMYLINSKSPCLLKDENGSYNYLILPINFSAI